MTTTTQGTRTALIRARFADMDTLDLETASYLLRGLDDLLFFDWLSGVGESGSTLTLDQQRAYEAWSPVIRRISYNSPLEVLLWASGSVGIGHQAVRLFERVHQARERKARADLVVDTYDLVRELLPKRRRPDPATEQAITRAANVIVTLDSLAVVDEEEA